MIETAVWAAGEAEETSDALTPTWESEGDQTDGSGQTSGSDEGSSAPPPSGNQGNRGSTESDEEAEETPGFIGSAVGAAQPVVATVQSAAESAGMVVESLPVKTLTTVPKVPALPLSPPKATNEDEPVKAAAQAPVVTAAEDALAAVAPATAALSLAATAAVALGAASASSSALLGRLREMGALILSPLYTRLSRSSVLENEVRDALFRRIQAAPGLSLAELSDGGPVTRNAVVHHLRILEEQSLVVSRRVGRTRRFYANGSAPNQGQMAVVATLGNPTTRAIADAIRAAPGEAQGEVCARFSLSPSLAHWHLRRLEEAGLVTKQREGRRVRYFPTPSLGGAAVVIHP